MNIWDYFDMILLGVIILVSIYLIYDLLSRKLTPLSKLTPVLPDELPPVPAQAFDSITRLIAEHRLEHVGDFKGELEKERTSYFRFFKDPESAFFACIQTYRVKKAHVLAFSLNSHFEDGTNVTTTNINFPTFYVIPATPERQFPRCMPDELTGFHKEFISQPENESKRSALPQNRSIPDLYIDNMQQTYRHLLEKKYIRKDKKNEGIYRFTIFYTMVFCWFRGAILDSVLGVFNLSHSPNVVKGKKYKRTFNPVIRGDIKRTSGSPHSIRKTTSLSLWIWIFSLIFLLFINDWLDKPPAAGEDGLSPKNSYYRKLEQYRTRLNSFGEAPIGELTENLEKISRWHETHSPRTAGALSPGLSRERITKLFEDLPIKPTEELYTLYSWRNGQQQGQSAVLFPGFRFLPLEEAMEDYRRAGFLARAQRTEGGWSPYYFPILEWCGNVIEVACGWKGKGTLRLRMGEYDFDPAAYPSIAGLMQEVAEYYDKGAIYVNNGGSLEVDPEKEHDIFTKYHPYLSNQHTLINGAQVKIEKVPGGGKIVSFTSRSGVRQVKTYDGKGRLIRDDIFESDEPVAGLITGYNEEGKIIKRRVEWRYGVHADIAWEYPAPNRCICIDGTLKEHTGDWEVAEYELEEDGGYRRLKRYKTKEASGNKLDE